MVLEDALLCFIPCTLQESLHCSLSWVSLYYILRYSRIWNFLPFVLILLSLFSSPEYQCGGGGGESPFATIITSQICIYFSTRGAFLENGLSMNLFISSLV